MAKKKPAAPVIFECVKCISSVTINSIQYCRLKIRDINKPNNMGIVDTVIGCTVYKEIRKF